MAGRAWNTNPYVPRGRPTCRSRMVVTSMIRAWSMRSVDLGVCDACFGRRRCCGCCCCCCATRRFRCCAEDEEGAQAEAVVDAAARCVGCGCGDCCSSGPPPPDCPLSAFWSVDDGVGDDADETRPGISDRLRSIATVPIRAEGDDMAAASEMQSQLSPEVRLLLFVLFFGRDAADNADFFVAWMGAGLLLLLLLAVLAATEASKALITSISSLIGDNG